MTKQKLEQKLRKRGIELMDSSEAKKAVNYGIMVTGALTMFLPGGGSFRLIKSIASKTMKGLIVTRVYQNRKPIVDYYKKLKDTYNNKP